MVTCDGSVRIWTKSIMERWTGYADYFQELEENVTFVKKSGSFLPETWTTYEQMRETDDEEKIDLLTRSTIHDFSDDETPGALDEIDLLESELITFPINPLPSE